MSFPNPPYTETPETQGHGECGLPLSIDSCKTKILNGGTKETNTLLGTLTVPRTDAEPVLKGRAHGKNIGAQVFPRTAVPTLPALPGISTLQRRPESRSF